LGLTALALAGCGRKGPLDLPPTASSQPLASSQAPAAIPSDPAAAQASKPSVFDPSYGADAPPTAGKGPKRPFALDPILNSN